MNEKESGREHTGIAAEMKVLLREPPLLIGILAVFLLFAVFYYLSFCENSSRSDIGRLDARRHG